MPYIATILLFFTSDVILDGVTCSFTNYYIKNNFTEAYLRDAQSMCKQLPYGICWLQI